jgi:hypothetical protein
MIDKGGTGPRDGLVFLATAPLLSPVIIVLAFTVLGTTYALIRIAASVVVVFTVALVVRPFLSDRPSSQGPGLFSSCGTSSERGSATLSGWDFLRSLIRYAFYGIVLGALFTAALPPEYIASVLRPGPLATAVAVVVGVPINMCAGEEILLTAPLVGMGFTMGHAIAFALASTGICLGSLPLLTAALGRRAMLALVAVYLSIPFVLGVLLDVLPFAWTLGPEPF